jgi:glycosyltransferase involved in cell wall biosynthesis
VKNLTEKISIIMPAYNEGEHIYKNIKETSKVFEKYNCNYEIIVVSDGSKDNTLSEALKAAEENHAIIVKHHRKNYGKGRALRMGFRFAKGELILFLDADMELHPAQTQVLLDIMRLTNADVVIGSKMHPLSQVEYPWHRRIVSKVYFFLVKLLFGLPIHDTQTGIKLFKKEVLKKVFPKILVKQYAYDLETLVLAHYLGYKIVEAPVVLKFKRKWSRVKLRDIFYTWWDTMAIFYRLYILRYYQKKLRM